MSRTREVVGQDERGRPIARWADGEPEARQFGHMEPAFDAAAIERRQLTPDELAPRLAPDPRVTPLPRATRPAPPKEEVPVSEPRADHAETIPAEEPPIRSTNIPEDIPELVALIEQLETEPVPPDPLTDMHAALAALADRAVAAQVAWANKLQAAELAIAADQQWEEANRALRGAWSVVGGPLGGFSASPAEVRHERLLEEIPRTGRVIQELQFKGARASVALDHDEARGSVELDEHPEGARTVKSSAAHPAIDPDLDTVLDAIRGMNKAARDAGIAPDPLTPHQRRTLELTIKHNGDRRAVAKELGSKHVQSVDVALAAAGKKGQIPVELIVLLPARFAKYATVPA